MDFVALSSFGAAADDDSCTLDFVALSSPGVDEAKKKKDNSSSRTLASLDLSLQETGIKRLNPHFLSSPSTHIFGEVKSKFDCAAINKRGG